MPNLQKDFWLAQHASPKTSAWVSTLGENHLETAPERDGAHPQLFFISSIPLDHPLKATKATAVNSRIDHLFGLRVEGETLPMCEVAQVLRRSPADASGTGGETKIHNSSGVKGRVSHVGKPPKVDLVTGILWILRSDFLAFVQNEVIKMMFQAKPEAIRWNQENHDH